MTILLQHMVLCLTMNECRYFHVTTGLVPDIMHDILEGSLEVCLRQVLIHFIKEEKLFTLVLLNIRITSFHYGPTDVKNKPAMIAPDKLSQGGNLK